MKKRYVTLSFLLVFVVFTKAQQPFLIENNKPNVEGKCFKQNEVHFEKPLVNEKVVPIYTGNKQPNRYVQQANLCYLREKDAPYSIVCKDFLVVTNTIEEPNYEDKTMYLVIKEFKSIESVEVICDAKITTALLTKIHKALKTKGFTSEEYTDKATLMDALIRFQMKNNLPQGTFNTKSMLELGVIY